MVDMEWSDKIGSRDRRAWLLIVKSDVVIPFTGVSIPGSVAVVGTSYVKNGKWSHTTFRLKLADGVRVIPGRDGWGTGRFVEGLGAVLRLSTDTWTDVAAALGVSIPSAMAFLRAWRPRAAEALDEVDRALVALDETDGAHG